jgi:altronate dehydratase small subunit
MEQVYVDSKAALVIHPIDNVAVALCDLQAGEECVLRLGEQVSVITLLEDIQFGHKIALQHIAANGRVLKYGEEIGKMHTPVEKGGWIHTHNMFCDRGKK